MANIHKSAAELIGNTPLLEVTNIERDLGLKAKVLVKLEYFNPAGSVKDRIAKAMIEDAEAKGLLGEGSTIIEKAPRSLNPHPAIPVSVLRRSQPRRATALF